MNDNFNRNITYLRLSVTDRCNLRCKYCMPADGVMLKQHSQMMSQEEMICAVKACSDLGIKKVRITGGEPLVKKNIVEICRSVSAIDKIEEVCITTNATLLAPLASELVNAGVSRINISLDTLDPQKYSQITRTGNLADALNGIESALSAGFKKVKINTVLIKGFNDCEILDFAELSLKYPVDIRFIELMPMTSCIDYKNMYLSSKAVLETVSNLNKIPVSDGVSENYRIGNAPGTIGLISTISNKFCLYCNRIRITADGYIKPCLHSGKEFCIKGLNKEDMKVKIQEAILAKPKSRPDFLGTCLSNAGRFMNQIGG